MPDSTAALIAEVAALQEELATTQAERDGAEAQRALLETQLVDATAVAGEVPALQAQIAHLESLLAPPPPQSGIVTVTYSDGRVKYAAPDGDKFPLAADAEHHAKVLTLTGLYGMSEAQAQIALARGFDPP